MNISILVCTHKITYLPQSKILFPIFVGRSRNNNINIPKSYLSDNVKDNISDLNGSYCELTGLYWAWKNVDSDFVGLCHYRRYFSFRSNGKFKQIYNRFLHYFGHIYYAVTSQPKVGLYYPYQYTVSTESELTKVVDRFEHDFIEWINDYPDCELFALKPVDKGMMSNYFQFSSISGSHHLELIRKVIASDFPDILPYYNKTLLSNKLFYANMIIMKRELFQSYCRFLFSSLEKYNSILLQEGYYLNTEEKSISRISGYMGELLTSSFVSYYIANNQTERKYKLLYQVQYAPK